MTVPDPLRRETPLYGPFGLFHDPGWGTISFTQFGSIVAASLALGSFVSLIGFLTYLSWPALTQKGVTLITTGVWYYPREKFGALAMIYGTITSASVALILAAPVGILSAIWIAEYAPRWSRLPLKGAVEFLAGVPSIVFGLMGVITLRPVMQEFSGGGDSLMTAALLLAIMILPTLTTLVEDSLQAVPGDLRTQARALGLSREEAIRKVILPGARRGIVAATLLALTRAFGETIAVYLVVGRADNRLPESLLNLQPLIESGQTLTSKLGGSEVPMAYGDPLHMGALASLGLILIVITVFTTFLGQMMMGSPEKGS